MEVQVQGRGVRGGSQLRWGKRGVVGQEEE